MRNLQASVVPKLHLLEDRTVEQVKEKGGVAEKTEDYIEKAHQLGMKDDRRTNNMKDKNLAAVSQSHWETTANDPNVKAKKLLVKNNNKRKMTMPSKAEERDALSKNNRNQRRKTVADTASLEPQNLFTGAELNRIESRDPGANNNEAAGDM